MKHKLIITRMNDAIMIIHNVVLRLLPSNRYTIINYFPQNYMPTKCLGHDN